jgi:hypothetical protein
MLYLISCTGLTAVVTQYFTVTSRMPVTVTLGILGTWVIASIIGKSVQRVLTYEREFELMSMLDGPACSLRVLGCLICITVVVYDIMTSVLLLQLHIPFGFAKVCCIKIQ